ncbi:MAG: hypothetical protein ACO24H_10790 [Polynucleobacter sp.]
MSTIPVYATVSQIVSLLKRQNYSFTPDQIRTNSFKDEGGKSVKIRQGVVDDLLQLAEVAFSPNIRSRVVSAVESLTLRSPGRVADTRSTLLKSGFRCFTVCGNKRISVPAGAFFNLQPGEKATAYFIDNGKESYIKVIRHR